MSREDDREDAPPRRRDRWGEEDSDAGAGMFRLPASERSGAVTGAGIVTLTLGILTLLLGLCGGGIALFAGISELERGGMMHEAQGPLVVVTLALLVSV